MTCNRNNNTQKKKCSFKKTDIPRKCFINKDKKMCNCFITKTKKKRKDKKIHKTKKSKE